ncbi:hypothetical protein BDL97_04G103400 [Sphagnum fallax]|nr:hypothetical protein BDL97_04G103400 [Sphagnum fallax]KAH8965151.1 hypothetical protein BDL97_04G103400 [Sphagnum fallax]
MDVSLKLMEPLKEEYKTPGAGYCERVANHLAALVNQVPADLHDRKSVEDQQELGCACFWRAIVKVLVWILVVGHLIAVGCAYFFLFFAPNTRTDRVYLQHGFEDYAIKTHFNELASYGLNVKESEYPVSGNHVVSCPCTTTTVSWTDFVHFYVINNSRGDLVYKYDSNDNLIDFSYAGCDDSIDPKYLSRTFKLKKDNVCTFCGSEHVNIFPHALNTGHNLNTDCEFISNLFVTTQESKVSWGRNWRDNAISYFQSPVLLHQKFLYSNTIQLLKSQLEKQFLLLRVNPRTVECVNTTHVEMFQEGLAQQWINVLETFAANSGSSDSDYFKNAGSRAVEYYKSTSTYYKYHFMVVLDPRGQSVLGMNMDWKEYYNQCKPHYCDVTRPNSLYRRIYLIAAQLGGLAALVYFLFRCIVCPLLPKIISRSARAHNYGSESLSVGH